ncbi:MAG TPA: glycosyltransferase family 2 protein [Methylomusa anaerophila]|uniref:SPBc2 prophage-derived glycosyltransferase SunS n=1 Tax=Methylomusa anaerophila TaxID=1930071 RepID=A0A348AKK4_9FIRM|nr:glycosyltransferase family 2 protein [Methylomusa anaerophila]BBB91602.1 SPBc2 prophage-derived glycosyltransferase SunS [Methylomusa anaerophila]HML89460.1 glycosyltransferase family 2 protein [Methylomusa anaerophila]
MTLTVLILAKNEEKNIRECIESAKFADEIIVIDDFSTDDTKAIAESLGAKVYQRAMNGDWGAQQTYAIQLARTEWIFFLDADERIPPALAVEIRNAVKLNEKYTYKVSRLNHIMGQALRHGGWYPDFGIHLLPREGSYVEGFVHPRIHHNYPEKQLKNHMLHYPYTSWEHYFNKLNLYTRLAAEKNRKNGKKANFFFDIMIRPHVAFFKMYILKAGWRDGKVGFILASFHYCYTMAKYVKLYYLQKTNKDNYSPL